jgi:prepilin-type N-terminal cleavage/methylation domain-containing protein
MRTSCAVSAPTRAPAGRRYAFTLIECLMATVVLSVAVLAVVYAVAAGQKETYATLDDMRAQSLAEALMEEVIAHPYAPQGDGNSQGPESGETRATFVSADDFDGFTEAAGTLKDATGTAYPAPYQGFSRGVSAAFTTATVSGARSPVAGVLVSVTVSDRNGVRCQLQRFVR